MEITTLESPVGFPETILGCMSCAADDICEADALPVLSESERARYRGIKSTAASRRFAAGRFALRVALASALGLKPAAVTLTQTPAGKPLCEQGWQCSLSHSGDWVLLALHPHLAVGVDLEEPRLLRAPEQLLKRFGVATLPEDKSEPAAARKLRLSRKALHIWNRNEAVMKAIGHGMAHAYKLSSLGDHRFLWEQQEIQSLNVRFTPAPDYLATFAIILL